MAMSGRTQKGKRYVHDHRTFCMQHNTCSYCLYPAKPSMVTNIFHAGHCIDQAHNLLPSASSLARNLGKPFAFNCALNFRSCQLIVHLHIEILIRFVPFHLWRYNLWKRGTIMFLQMIDTRSLFTSRWSLTSRMKDDESFEASINRSNYSSIYRAANFEAFGAVS